MLVAQKGNKVNEVPYGGIVPNTCFPHAKTYKTKIISTNIWYHRASQVSQIGMGGAQERRLGEAHPGILVSGASAVARCLDHRSCFLSQLLQCALPFIKRKKKLFVSREIMVATWNGMI